MYYFREFTCIIGAGVHLGGGGAAPFDGADGETRRAVNLGTLLTGCTQ
jgi:hypothetical protein